VEHAGKLKVVTGIGCMWGKGEEDDLDVVGPGKDHIELAGVCLALTRAVMLK